MGTLWGVILFAILEKHKSLSVLLVVVKNMKGHKMKKNEITCDLCGVTVAEKDDCFLSRFKTKIPYIKVPYNYIGADYCYATDYVFSCNAKKDFHICENCLECIKKDLIKAKETEYEN
jgi:hypothetical protein